MNMLTAYTHTSEKTTSFRYWLHLPDDYASSGDKTYPLILFLHGAGERGNGGNETVVKVHGLPKMIDRGEKVDAIVVSPQCENDKIWNTQVYALKELLDSIIAQYRVDTRRVCCTGLSMGGYGTWMMALTFPDLFWRIAPVCGGGIAWMAGLLKNVEIRAYHGGADGVVNPAQSVEMVEAVKRAGGNAELTIYDGVGHDSWVNAYERSDMVAWLTAERAE